MISSQPEDIGFNRDPQHSVAMIYNQLCLLQYQPSHFVESTALSFRIKVSRAFHTPGINAPDQRHLDQ